jgi:hypothetical protein
MEPAPRNRMGFVESGCLVVAGILGLLLIGAFAGGCYWCAHNSIFCRGLLWVYRINAVSKTPVTIPQFSPRESQIEALQERWEKYDSAVRRDEAAEIALNASDLNALLTMNPKFAGNVFASIIGNRLRFQIAFPITKRLASQSQYFTFDVVIEATGTPFLDRHQPNHITINGKPLPRDLLEWTLHSRQLGDVLSGSREANRIGSMLIQQDQLVLRSRNN